MSERVDELSWGDVRRYAAGSLVGALLGGAVMIYLEQAMAAQSPGFWFVSRAAGIVSYLLLWVSTSWGIMLSTKGTGRLTSGPLVFALHNFTGWLALGFSTIHALSLLGDRVVPFSVAGILVPFASEYQWFLTGLGTLSLWIGALVSVTAYWRRQIGYRAWRTIHGLSYFMFFMATLHGATLGTDSQSLAVQLMYLGAGGSVVFLTLLRLLTARSEARSAAPTVRRA